MGRRVAAVRGPFGLVLALVGALAVAACGIGNPDPYAVLDQARTASYDRFQVNVGLTVDVDAQADPEFPGAGSPGFNVDIAPETVMLAADIPARKVHLRVAIPDEAFGPAGFGLGMPLQAMDLEVLSDGADVYVRSPLLPMALAGGIGGVPIEGDLTGWLQIGGVDELMALSALMGIIPGGAIGLPTVPELPLPSPGDAASLRTLLTDLGATIELVGTETVDGVEQLHLKGGVNIVSLVQSERFLSLTGMPRDAVHGIVDLEGTIGIATELWIEKSSGRLATLRVDGTSTNAPAVNLTFTLRVAEPGPDITFAAPATFTDINLAELIGSPLPGLGVSG